MSIAIIESYDVRNARVRVPRLLTGGHLEAGHVGVGAPDDAVGAHRVVAVAALRVLRPHVPEVRVLYSWCAFGYVA